MHGFQRLHRNHPLTEALTESKPCFLSTHINGTLYYYGWKLPQQGWRRGKMMLKLCSVEEGHQLQVSTSRSGIFNRWNAVGGGTWGPQAKDGAQTYVRVRTRTAAPTELHSHKHLKKGTIQGLHNRGSEYRQDRCMPAASYVCLTVQIHLWVKGALSSQDKIPPSSFLLQFHKWETAVLKNSQKKEKHS